MAVVLEAHYSKKLGLPGYSSHSYGVTVRAELSDINQVPEESRRIYQLLQESVDREICNTGWLPVAASEGKSPGGIHVRDEWSCSPKQRDLILKVVDEHQLDKSEIDDLSRDRFGKGVRQLNRMEASGLIDELLEKHGGSQNGNGCGSSYRRNGSFATNGSRR